MARFLASQSNLSLGWSDKTILLASTIFSFVSYNSWLTIMPQLVFKLERKYYYWVESHSVVSWFSLLSLKLNSGPCQLTLEAVSQTKELVFQVKHEFSWDLPSIEQWFYYAASQQCEAGNPTFLFLKLDHWITITLLGYGYSTLWPSQVQYCHCSFRFFS
jgi:hypothetical protein